MFRSIKLKNRHLTIFSLICVSLAAAACFLMLRTQAPDTITVNGEAYSPEIADDADAGRLLEACGYGSAALLSETEITVPKHWNKVYTDYNELQRRQGFDLVPYKGREVVEQTYAADDGRVIVLLTCGGRLIAAHVCDSDGSNLEELIH